MPREMESCYTTRIMHVVPEAWRGCMANFFGSRMFKLEFMIDWTVSAAEASFCHRRHNSGGSLACRGACFCWPEMGISWREVRAKRQEFGPRGDCGSCFIHPSIAGRILPIICSLLCHFPVALFCSKGVGQWIGSRSWREQSFI